MDFSHPELNINFNPQEIDVRGGSRRPHSCFYTLGRVSYDEARTIARTISLAAQPMLKWVAVDHAFDRGESADDISAQFPWLDIYDPEDHDGSDSDSGDDSADDSGDSGDDNDDEVSIEDGEIPPVDVTVADIPKDITDSIYQTWNVTPQQVDTMMQLISLAENGSTQWPLFYNYIEYGDDSNIRGYTTTIFGATSGTGSLLRVFEKLKEIDADHPLVVTYMDALEKARGGDITGLEGLAHVDGDPTKAVANYATWVPNGRAHLDHIQGDLATLVVDDRWRTAVWLAFLELNWESAAHFCNKTGPCADRPGPVLTTPLAKGFMVDTSLNHGDCRWWNQADTWTCLWDEMESQPETERAWLKAFMKARRRVLRSGFRSLDWSQSGDRVSLWLALLRENNMSLQRPILVENSSNMPPIWPPGLEIV